MSGLEDGLDEEDIDALISDELEILNDVEGDRAGSRYCSVSGRRRLAFQSNSQDAQPPPRVASTTTSSPPSSSPAVASSAAMTSSTTTSSAAVTSSGTQPVTAARRYISATGGFPLASSGNTTTADDGPESYEVPMPTQTGSSRHGGSNRIPQSHEVPFADGSDGGPSRSAVTSSRSSGGGGAQGQATTRPRGSASSKRPYSSISAVGPGDGDGDIDDLLDLEEAMHDEDSGGGEENRDPAGGAVTEPPTKRPYLHSSSATTTGTTSLVRHGSAQASSSQHRASAAAAADDFDDLLDLEDELSEERSTATTSSSSQRTSSLRRHGGDELDGMLDLEDEINARAAAAGGGGRGAPSQSQRMPSQGGVQSQRMPSQGGVQSQHGRPRMAMAEDDSHGRLDDLLGMQSRLDARDSGFGGGGGGSQLRRTGGSQKPGMSTSPSAPSRRNVSTASVASATRSSTTDDLRDDGDWSPASNGSDDHTVLSGGGDILGRAAARERVRRYLDMRRVQGRVYRRPPVSESLTVISTDGAEYVYVTTRTVGEERERMEKAKESWSQLGRHQLLPVPIGTLLQDIRDQQRQRTLDEFDATMASLNTVRSPGPEGAKPAGDGDAPLDDDYFGDDSHVKELTKSPPPPAKPLEPCNRLWVDKYSPQAFTELLSDDGTNRLLLSWLKLWDGVVFGRKVPAPVQSKEPEKSLTPGLEGYDESGRPKQKIALLSGPPGLGKTTLAHVIAEHAGYRVLEINASDDRSPEVLRQRIETATQNHSVIGDDKRPTCLVIDEIDGAQAAAITVLLAACGATKKGKREPPAISTAPMRKKRRSAVQGLSRPVICICNDQYGPALRPLRQQALTVVFYPTQANKLATRLLKVSRAEHLHADMTTLLALCEKAEKDIRSCINTLQFLHRQKKPITLFAIRSTAVGQKDAHKSLFELWQAVFQLPKAKRQRAAREGGTAAQAGKRASTNVLSITNRFRNVLLAAQSTGEHDRVRQGLFENYLEMRYKDPSMESITTALGWLSDIDLLDHRMKQTQNYSFMKFLPFLPVVFHLLFATPSYPKLKYPHVASDNLQKLTHSQQIFTSLLAETPPFIRQHFNMRRAVLDILPPLMDIISPVIRPVNTQLYNSKERQQLLSLISNMISYNLSYNQERQQDGQYQFVMDPNAEELVRYPGLPQKKQITYAGKQLITREIELEKMRRLEQAITGAAPGTAAIGKTADDPAAAAAASAAIPEVPVPGAAAKTPAQVAKEAKDAKKKDLEAKKKLLAKKKPVKVAVDFFGRPVQPRTTSTSPGSKGAKSADSGPLLWFKFHEGFSNAVRKPIKIQDLL